jgi:hypothetical protein
MEEREDVIALYQDVASLAITYTNLGVGSRFIQPQLVPYLQRPAELATLPCVEPSNRL